MRLQGARGGGSAIGFWSSGQGGLMRRRASLASERKGVDPMAGKVENREQKAMRKGGE